MAKVRDKRGSAPFISLRQRLREGILHVTHTQAATQGMEAGAEAPILLAHGSRSVTGDATLWLGNRLSGMGAVEQAALVAMHQSIHAMAEATRGTLLLELDAPDES